MMRDLIRRLSRLEGDLLPPDDGFEVTLIRVRGGFPGDVLRATIGPRRIEQFPGETEADFIDRCFDVAIEERAPYIVLGGLPNAYA